MFGEVAFAVSERVRPANLSNVKAAFAHLSPIAVAALVAGIGISLTLTVFLLPGAGTQSGPTPLLPSSAGNAGRMAADLPPAAHRRAPESVGAASSSSQLVATRTELVPQRQRTATKAHRAHRHSRARLVRRTPAAHMQVRGSAARAAPATTRRFFSTSGKAKSNARNHGHSRSPNPAAGAPRRAHGHGKAVGHSSEHHHRRAPGRSKKAPTGSSHAPAPPKANGGGKGSSGGKK